MIFDNMYLNLNSFCCFSYERLALIILKISSFKFDWFEVSENLLLILEMIWKLFIKGLAIYSKQSYWIFPTVEIFFYTFMGIFMNYFSGFIELFYLFSFKLLIETWLILWFFLLAKDSLHLTIFKSITIFFTHNSEKTFKMYWKRSKHLFLFIT